MLLKGITLQCYFILDGRLPPGKLEPPSMKFTSLHPAEPSAQVFVTRIRYELYFTFAFVHLDTMLRYSHRALMRSAV